MKNVNYKSNIIPVIIIFIKKLWSCFEFIICVVIFIKCIYFSGRIILTDTDKK